MNIKGMQYPAKNYAFNTEKEIKSASMGKEKGIKKEPEKVTSLKKMFGGGGGSSKPLFGKGSKKLGTRKV